MPARSWTLPLIAFAALAAAACDDPLTAPSTPAFTRTAPDSARIYAEPHEWSDIRDQYIIRFRDDEPNPRGLAESLVRQHGGRIHYVYVNVMKGFAATLPAPVADALRRHPKVARVSPDAPAILTGVQTGAPWHLDRDDQRYLPLDGQYQYSTTGSGTRVYIVDSGIRYSHADFGGRAILGHDFVNPADSGADCLGHGTVVASAAGGATHGVAKQATLVSVRTFDCAGSSLNSNGVTRNIAGLDWIAGQSARPAVVNLSFVAGCTSSGCINADLESAVQRVLNAGYVVVAAAGNRNRNACDHSPARMAGVITVGASNSSDARWAVNSDTASNYGSCLDLFAPGAAVTTAAHFSDTGTRTESGTSLAAPQVAGAIARFLEQHPTATASAAWNGVYQSATYDVLSNIGSGSPNVLLLADVTYPITSGGIGGPEMIFSDGTYSWQLLNVSGGTGSFYYTWEVDWWDTPFEGPVPVDTGNPFSMYVDGCDGHFDLSVYVTSGTARTRLSGHIVENYAPTYMCGW